MSKPFVLLNGDTLFETAALERLLVAPSAPLTLAVNLKVNYDADDMKVALTGTRLRAVSKTLPLAEVDAESIGLMVFRGQGPKLFRDTLTTAMTKPDAWQAWYLSAVATLAQTAEVETASIAGLRWWEVDTLEDLVEARRGLAAEKPTTEGLEDRGRRPGNRATSPHVRSAKIAPRMRIGLLNNLRAGRNQRRIKHLLDAISGEPDVVHLETSRAELVPDALAEFARQDIELLVVNGGDGTLARTLTEFFHEGAFEGRVPLISVLRGGRTNMTALDLGVQRDPVRAMVRLIEIVRAGKLDDHIVERPVLRVQYGPQAKVHYGMFFGAGVIHRGIELAHRTFRNNQQGVFGASLVTASLLTRMGLAGSSGGVLAPDKIGVLVDQMSVCRGASRIVLATSLERLFLRMRPFWGDGPGGIRFTSVAADAPALGRSIPGILAGHPGRAVKESNGYVSRNAHGVEMLMNCGFTVDGELVDPVSDRMVSITADQRVRFVRA